MKKSYHVKFLTKKDAALAEEVCQKSEDYFLMEQGRAATLADAEGIISDLPEGKTRFDKFVIAILDDNEEAIGLVDVLADFPRKGQWMIGLLLLVPEVRQTGMGRVLHQVIKEWAEDGGADSLRIGVLKENSNAREFWEHLGYQFDSEKETIVGGKKHLVDVLTLAI
ncbi:GNAT family acetyltransferase [Listeria floridensis FSL S10-1187]|uniref:GNAT family acetyltransferase n=1 Tax=Listeria floridensis FSL S10-1187 TaxID=1265817 RepID=A0ABN0RIQ5_9LIST|nr:GNAT family N-acetyltransferase [Listeria floridensis]EUJ33822.1 GNAT family acetyltransferase [Listeria floridensis FSL S10-1187]